MSVLKLGHYRILVVELQLACAGNSAFLPLLCSFEPFKHLVPI